MKLLILGLGGAELILISIVLIPFIIIPIISYWKIFEKAGESGWATLIPIYNLITLMKIIGKPWWWVLLCIIPLPQYLPLARERLRRDAYCHEQHTHAKQ
ncbi:MAG: hypothetical protein J0L99_17070 [Chitinophagales bacterium]|nr:hypothetical protein [Chitinophagales bacterium]